MPASLVVAGQRRVSTEMAFTQNGQGSSSCGHEANYVLSGSRAWLDWTLLVVVFGPSRASNIQRCGHRFVTLYCCDGL